MVRIPSLLFYFFLDTVYAKVLAAVYSGVDVRFGA
jgi:hypothetical protein